MTGEDVLTKANLINRDTGKVMSAIKKLKHNGMTLRYREKRPEERVTKKTLRRFKGSTHYTKSSQIGDKVSDHLEFEYIEVTSAWYTGE